MYLKSLTLKGFKSFADKTSLVFEDGLNVVVGPNGSGKSNVADAILWVLGEQSAKQLRGQAMEDVIFSGSAERKSVSVAEVVLVLSNEDGKLPLDFAEIAICRRMYRTGESEYFINGAPSRLLDITDILHDSGLGRETSSIISQGKLDAVLSNRPEERRELVEEAAGIAKHRRRKKRAERKLLRMDEHVARAKIINRELRRRLRPLEEQVGKAQSFKELEQERKTLATEIAVDDVRKLQVAHGDLQTKKQEAAAQISLREYEEKEKQARLEKLQVLLEKRGVYVGDISEQRRRVTHIEATLTAELRLLEEKVHAAHEQRRTCAQQIKTLRAQTRESQSRALQLSRSLAEAKKDERHHQAALETYEPKAKEIARAIEEGKKRIARLQADEAHLKKEADEALLAHTKLLHEIESQELQEGIWVKKLEELDERLEDIRKQEKEAKDRSDLAEKEQKTLLEKKERSTQASNAAKEKLAQLRRDYLSCQEKLLAHKTELQTLENLFYDSDTTEATPVLQKAQKAHQILGRLGTNLVVPQALEAVVEVLLGAAFNARLATSQDIIASIFQGLSEHSEQTKEGFVAQPTKAPTPSQPPQKATPFLELYDARAQEEGLAVPRAARALFARLFENVYVCDTDEQALRLAQEFHLYTFVSEQGLIAEASGIIKTSRATRAADSQMARVRRLRTLRARVPKQEKELNAYVQNIKKTEAQSASLADELDLLFDEQVKLRARLEDAQNAGLRAEREIKSLLQEKETITSSQKKVLDEADKNKRTLKTYDERIYEAQAKLEKAEEERRAAAAEQDDLRSQEIEYLKNLNEEKLALKTAQETIARLEQEQSRADKLRVSSSHDIQALSQKKAHFRVFEARFDPLNQLLLELSQHVQALVEKLQDSAALAVSDSSKLRETIDEARQELARAHEQTEAVREHNTQLEIEEGKIEVKVTNAVEALKEVGHMSLDEALLLEPLEDRQAKVARLQEVKVALAELGPVNQVALEEYDELKERATFYAHQLEDLKLARRALAKITKTIDARMHEAFQQTFEAVNQHFAETFTLLFPGGKAHLELSDPDNLEETGLEIIAQPRGKRIPKIALMSGGEKSLTALAFLFAIYQTHTVPFYVFDEVEAALDDANLDKFLHAIDLLKKTTQLIVISHQRRTMEAADILYGVSMQSDGISKVVSQKLDEYEKQFLETAS